jgi:hypothetical protein
MLLIILCDSIFAPSSNTTTGFPTRLGPTPEEANGKWTEIYGCRLILRALRSSVSAYGLEVGEP